MTRLTSILALILLAATWAAGQDPPPDDAAQDKPRREVSKEQIETLQQQLEADERDIEPLNTARQQCVEALAAIEAARTFKQQAAEFERQRLAADSDMEAIRAELAKTPVTTPDPAPEATLEQLKQQRDQAEASLDAAQERVTELEQVRTARETRRGEIPTRKEQLTTGLEDLQRELGAPTAEGELPELTQARRYRLLATQRRLEAEMAMLEEELASYDARTELLPLRAQQWTARVAARETLLKGWRDVVNRKEQAAARQAARDARRRAEEAIPALREIADGVADLIERRTGPEGVVTRKAEAEKASDRLDSELRRIEFQYELTKSRARLAQTSASVDIRLRQDRIQLPDITLHRRDYDRRQATISDVQVQLFDLDYELSSLAPNAEREAEILAKIPAADRNTIGGEVRQLLADQRTAYADLLRNYNEYLSWLVRAQTTEQRIIETARSYIGFIDERILWIRSASPIRASDIPRAGERLAALLSPTAWSEVVSDLARDMRSHPVSHGLCLILAVALLASRRWFKRKLEIVSTAAQRPFAGHIGHTGLALAITAGLAATLPLLMWFIAWRLRAVPEPDPFAEVAAAGLSRTARAVLFATTLWEICRPHGLAQAHFGWRDQTRSVIRRNVAWLLPIGAATAFLISAEEYTLGDAGSSPLGRLAFMIVMPAVAVFFARVLRPKGGALESWLEQRRGGWIERFRYAWYAVIVVIPVILAISAAKGYYYSALRIEQGIALTVWLLLVVIFADSLLVRWSFLAQRRIVAREEHQRLQAEAEQRAAEAEQGGEGAASEIPDEPPIEIDEGKLTLEVIGLQTLKIQRLLVLLTLFGGLWFIWADMHPAIRMLERVQIWPRLTLVTPLDDIPESRTDLSTLLPSRAPSTTETPPAGDASGVDAGAADTAETPPDPKAETTSAPIPMNPAALAASTTGSGSAGPAADEPTQVTLANVLFAIIIAGITIMLSINLPGMLEIAVLQRLPLDAGVRYAITTLCRYVVTIVGMILACSAVQIGWQQVQWLAAAITLGLGFGLQEIFANFVSGLIILFERPVRVGDLVTVGDVDGTVTRIRTRATTIVDWDRKEMIVPNKEFITGRLINWSLSDSVTRLVIPVGIAYGSDTKKARELLLEVAREHPSVLETPAPSAIFRNFGDSSLDFQLRIYIPGMDVWASVMDGIHTDIDNAFRKAGIEIAFPQRDIHVRSLPADALPPPESSSS